jgi:hypothetical protein
VAGGSGSRFKVAALAAVALGVCIGLLTTVILGDYSPGSAAAVGAEPPSDADATTVDDTTAKDDGPVRLPCTDADQPVNFTFYSVGPAFEGLPVTDVYRLCAEPYPGEPLRANYVDYIYGTCTPPVPSPEVATGSGCVNPLEIQTWPACERTLADYSIDKNEPYPHEWLGAVRGAQAAEFDGGTRVELYTGSSTVVIFSEDPKLIAAALAALRPEPQDDPPSIPAADAQVNQELPSPTPGAVSGDLSCTT